MAIPHFGIPFFIDPDRGAHVEEQDSEEEILDCVETILRYQKNQRPESPDFGIPDVTFSEPLVNVGPIQSALIHWEPRIETKVNSPTVDNLIQTIVVEANFERS